MQICATFLVLSQDEFRQVKDVAIKWLAQISTRIRLNNLLMVVKRLMSAIARGIELEGYTLTMGTIIENMASESWTATVVQEISHSIFKGLK